jgi:hypothetical protein
MIARFLRDLFQAYADDRQKAPHNRHGKRWEHARDHQHRGAG